MATLFDNLGEPLIKGPGHTQDYQVTAGERFAEEWERGLEFNPVAYLGRQARFAVERNAPLFGLPSNMVSKEAAHEELKSRGLEGMITVGDEGISRTEFDMLQYIKQREINQQGMASAPQSFFSHAAGFAGSFAAGAVDPINIASAFIPIVPEARYAAWLAKAGTSFGARAGARATAGAIEGAVGAAMIEPFMYMGAQAEQRDYGVADSMMNIVFGTLLGGGLHTVGGAVYDWRMGRVMRSLDQGIQGLGLRDVASEASDQSQLDALRRFVEAEEAGAAPPDAERILREGLTPEVKADMEASRTMPDEVPEARRVDGQSPSPRGLTDLIDEAKADRTAEVFNRQFIDKEQRGEPLTGDVRAPREDIFEVAQANFVGATKHTAKTVPIEQLTGGVSKDPAETKRVQNLVDLMRGPAGFIERLIVDSRGNVIEGQHRLEALRQMGVKEVPVIEISELREGLPVEQMSEAIRSVRTTREEHVNQLIDRIAEAVADVGSLAEVRAQYEAPAGFERQWAAALDAAEAADDLKAQSDVRSKIAGGKFYDDEYGSIEKVLQGFESGELLVHARAKDGTDFQYGIDPRNGDFLKSTDSYASYVDAIRSEDPDAEPAELTFFSGVESGPVTSWADFFAKSGKQIELVFVRKSGDIQKSLGDGKVMTADGKVMPYDRSPLADYDNPAMRDEPGGVEPGDWYTDKTVDVVAVLDVADEAASMKAQSAPAKDASGNIGNPDIRFNRDFVQPDPKAMTETPQFKQWFKKSAVVGKDGEPVIMHHHGSFDEADGIAPEGAMHWGTKNAAIDRSQGKRLDDELAAVQAYEGEDGQWHWEDGTGQTSEDRGLPGYSSKDTALSFGRSIVKEQVEESDFDYDDLGRITSAWLSIQNPMRVEDQGADWSAAIQKAKELGHDGIVYTNRFEDKGSTSYITFEPTQVKSVNNTGAFSLDIADIRANRDLDNAPKKFPYQHDAQSRDIGTELMQSMNSSDGAPLAVEVGVPGMRPAREPLVMADGPDAPKVIGTDAAGRPVLDFRDSVVSHFTDEESAADINSNGYRVVGDGYYGEAISFTPNREFGRQFGGVETVARIAPDARILNTGLDADAKIIMSVLNDRRLVPNNPRLGQKTWRQAFLDLGVDGLYDPGAGDLFIYNAAKVWPVAAEDRLTAAMGRQADNVERFQRDFDAAVPRVDDLSASTPSDYRRMLDYFGPEYADAPVIGPKGDILFNAIDQESLGGPAIMVKEDGSVVAGIVAWHGSPHDFDRFDITKIGTGEGAQAYGHGLYFAEARRVGQKYRDMLSDMATALPGLDWKERADWTELQNEAYGLADHALEELQIDITQGGSERPTWQRVVDKVRNLAPAGREKDILRELDTLADKYGWKDYVNNNPGRLYLNFLAVRPEELLDWDRPLSEQPKFLQEFARTVDLSHLPSGSKTRRQIEMWREGTLPNKESEPTANVLHSAITDYGMDAQKNAEFAQQLKAAGVKGARYFDRDSRSLGNGTRNIVLFDDDLIDIIDKFQKDLDEQPDLVAAHNLTSANLLHADKMGGLAAPSLAIAKASDGHEGYGEITLIGSKDLVDPQKGAKVYAGDIYSARYPTVHYNIKYDAIRKLEKKFAATAKEMGVTVRESLDDDALEREGPRALENSVGAMLTYAKEKGISVEGYVFDHDAWEVRNRAAQAKEQAIREDWRAKTEAERERAQAEGRDPDETAIDDEFQPKYMEARREAISILREPDRALDEVKWKLRDKFRGDDQFLEWAAEKFAELKAKERIFKGFSDRTGGKMYAPHTLDNVVRLMTKKIRDAEGFNYGIGNLRAKVAPKFKSVEAIQGRKGSLVSRQEFDAIKKEADAELTAVADQLLPKAKYKGNTFGQMDALTQHMAEAIDRGNVKRVLQEYYNGITDDDVRMVGNFLQKLKSMPTTYFEAKLDRAVSIGEFEAAVVPNTITKKAREVLERSGVKQIIEYDPKVDGARQAAIDSIRDLKFQLDNDLRSKGFYSVLERSLQETTIKKASGKDWKGWLANRPGIKADEMEYTGLDDFLTLNQDAMLTKEEVLAHVKDNAVQLEEVTLGTMSRDDLRPDQIAIDKYKSEWEAVSKEVGDLNVRLRDAQYARDFEAVEDIEFELAEAQAELNIVHRKMVDDTITRTGVDVGPTRYAQYTLPGGVDYREVLLTMPAKPDVVYTKDNIIPIKPGDREWADDPDRFWYFLAPDNSFQILKREHPTQQGALDYIIAKKQPEPPSNRVFQSNHWKEKNVLAHARISDRTTESGKKALHVEEIQSDWHQEGRDKGYASQGDLKKFRELDAKLQVAREQLAVEQKRLLKQLGFDGYLQLIKEGTKEDAAKYSLLKSQDQQYSAANDTLVKLEEERRAANPVNKLPDAPFKKTWHELMLKRLIRYAAENGYDEIIITPGDVQAERFDLSNHVHTISYRKDGPLYEIAWEGPDGSSGVASHGALESELPGIVGKELAAKIVAGEGKSRGSGAARVTDLTGLDLKIGGEGMRGFYDKIVVDYLNKYGKKYGAKVGTDMIDTKSADADLGTVEVHSFPITEALREQAMKGMPLFQKDGTEGGGAVPSPGKRVTMAPVIKRSGKYAYEEMSSERAARSEKLREEVEALIDKYTGGRVGKRWVSSMRVKQGTQMMKVDGGFSARGQLIIMALDAADMTGSVKHEAIHALKELGVLTDREWDILVRTALDNGWLDKKYGNSKKTIRERYWDLPLIDQVEEAIAEEFRIGRWDSFQGYPEAIRPAQLKVREFFDRLAEIVRKIFGKEATAQDIFNAIERGEVGARQDVGGPVGEGPLTRGVPEDVRRSQDEAPPTPFDRWAADDAAIAAQAQQESQQADETLQDIEAELALSSAHIESMRQRGLLSVMDEEALRESDQMAKMMEEQAAAYEAAGICEGEA